MAVEVEFFDPAELEHLDGIARRRGYVSTRLYLRALVDEDAAANGEPLLFEDDDEDERIQQAIREGLREARNGQTLNEDDFWQAIEDDE